MLSRKDVLIPMILSLSLVALLFFTVSRNQQPVPTRDSAAAGGSAEYCRMTVSDFGQDPLKTCNTEVSGYLGGLGRVDIAPAVNLNNATVPNPVDTRCSVIQWDGVWPDVYVQYSADAWNYCHYETDNNYCQLNGQRGPFNDANQELLRQQFMTKCEPVATNTPTPRPTNTPTPRPTNTPTPRPTNTPTPRPTNTPTPRPTNTPTPITCTWESYSNAKWSLTNQNGWLDQWRAHTTFTSYKNKNTPKLIKTFTLNQTKNVQIALEQIQVNDNDGGACNPQFNEEAWVGVYKLNSSGQGIQLMASTLITDGNYDLSGDQRRPHTFTLNNLAAGTYGVSTIWAGDGRVGPDYNSSTARTYVDPETGASMKYPARFNSDAYSNSACRWNGSYGIRTKVCI